MSTRPDLTQVRAWLKVSATQLPDDQLQLIYDAAVDDEANRCTVPADPAAYPAGLAPAFLRMIQRECAIKNIPLGVVGVDTAEFGMERLPWLDAQIEYHQRPYRKQVLG